MNDLETRLTAALTDTAQRTVPDSFTPPVFQPSVVPSPSSARGRWLLPVAAAAVVVAVAVGAVVGVQRLHHSGATRPAGTPTRVVFHTFGHVSLTPDQLQSAALTVTGRLAAAGIPDATVASDGSDQLVVSGSFTPDQMKQLPGLMIANALEFRPLLTMSEPVTHGVPLDTGVGRTVDPWRSLGFAPPTGPAGLAALTPSERQQVLDVVDRWNCQNHPLEKPDSPIVTCDASGHDVYLLGPAIFGDGQVKRAEALAPGTTTGQLLWTVGVDLKPAAQQSWADYTAKHNSNVAPTAVDDYVAFVSDTKVLVAAEIQSTITGMTQVVGLQDQSSAKALAAALSTDPLPVSFVE